MIRLTESLKHFMFVVCKVMISKQCQVSLHKKTWEGLDLNVKTGKCGTSWTQVSFRGAIWKEREIQNRHTIAK